MLLNKRQQTRHMKTLSLPQQQKLARAAVKQYRLYCHNQAVEKYFKKPITGTMIFLKVVFFFPVFILASMGVAFVMCFIKLLITGQWGG